MANSLSFAASWFPPTRVGAGTCLLSILLLAGCEGTISHPLLRDAAYLASINPGEPARQDAAVVQASAVSPAADPKEPPPGSVSVSPTPSSHPEPPGNGAISALTLAGAINQSLVANPDLVALRGRIEVNQAMVGVAKTYPWNPFVQAQFFPRGHPFVPGVPGEPASAAGESNYYIWVMQRFELAHQRQFRIQGALAALDQVQWNIFQGELLNVAQTTRLYFAALYQKELRDLAREMAELNDRLAGIVEQRFKANLAKASDVTTAKVAARQSERQAEVAEVAYQAALLALRQQLNVPVTAPLELTEKLGEIAWLPVCPGCRPGEEAGVAAELVEGRPDVLAAQAGVRVSDANFRLAKAAVVPDIQAGPIYETADDGTKYLGLRLQMNLPIFDTGKPLARQRQAERNLQQLTYDQLKVRAALEAQAAIDQYERVRGMAAKATPVRADAGSPELKEITKLFELGQADVLAVLTTQTNLLQERRAYLDLLNQLAQSAAAVIQAAGLPAQRVVQLTPGTCVAEPTTLPDCRTGTPARPDGQECPSYRQ